MGRIYKRGSLWYLDYIDAEGKRRRTKGSKDRALANRMLSDAERTVDKQVAGELPLHTTQKIINLEDLKAAYLEHARAALRPASVKGFITGWKHLIEPAGWRRVADVTLDGIQKITRRKQGAGVKGQTINWYIAIVRSAFRWAEELDKISHEPFKGWRALPKDEPNFRRDFTEGEVMQLINGAINPAWRIRYMLLAYTGLRVSTVIALRWSWLDFTQHRINVPAKALKGKRALEIPLHATLERELLAWRVAQAADVLGSGDERVTNERHKSMYNNRLHADMERLGIDSHGLCVHSFRHTVATRIYQATGSLKVAQELLGHASVATTANYLHTTDAEVRSGMDGLDYSQEAAEDEHKEDAG